MVYGVNRTRSIRCRAIGVLTSLAIGSTGALALSGNALATPGDGAPNASTTKSIASAALSHDKLPAGAVRATHASPKVGSGGVPFQKPGAGRSATTRIVGGAVANAADYPWIVGIETYFLGSDETGQIAMYIAYCTGTLISSTKILTAGHCNTDLPFGSTYVIAGRNDLDYSTGGYVARVSSTWTHPGYNLAAQNAGTTSVQAAACVAVLTVAPVIVVVVAALAPTSHAYSVSSFTP